MKLFIKENKIATESALLEPFLTKALLKVNGYKIERLELTIPNKDITIAEFLSFSPIASGFKSFPIWIEIPKALSGANIPVAFSFSTYLDEEDNVIQRKISDMSISAIGTINDIYYLQSVTSRITKSDLELIVANSNTIALSISERNALVNDPQGEYYVEEII